MATMKKSSAAAVNDSKGAPIQDLRQWLERVDKLEGKKSSLLDLDGTGGKITLGSLGGGMLLTGGIALVGWSRRKKNNGR